MTCYQSLNAKIKAASSIADLEKLDRLTTRIYDAGQLTPSELKRLDLKIIDKKIKFNEV